MHKVGLDIVEHALIVGDEQDCCFIGGQGVYPFRYSLEGVDIETGIGFIEYSQTWFEQGKLQYFEAFLFAARKTIIDIA
ncbi:MAG: hypothetical protein BWY75_03225 [bacterium ADurb.Bin425]|nr:MAG: hypothetical protein BWY75_03225 [bacterium ADurb.Bin425]